MTTSIHPLFRVAALLSATGLCALLGCGTRTNGPVDSCKSLKWLGTAALNYRDVHGSFPPPVVLDDHRKPMHSWRVLLLPFVEANAFFDEYDFDASWNDEANANLADGSRRWDREKFSNPSSVRSVYQPHCSALSPSDLTTEFLMVVEYGESLRSFLAVPSQQHGDGDLLTPTARNPDELIIVQLERSSVHWMEPKDVVLNSPTPEWGVPRDAIKDRIRGSVLVTGDDVVKCYDGETTLDILENRMSELK